MSPIYARSVPAFRRTLVNIEGWLDKATEHAKKKDFDTEVLVNARLAPDQFSFVEQIQSACDVAKFAAAKLSGKQPPSHPDTEKTFDELRARLKAVVTYLDTFAPGDFAGAEDRVCSHQWMDGKGLKGHDYLTELALPNFYFHATTAYAILRHNGVDVGKADYLGPLTLVDPR